MNENNTDTSATDSTNSADTQQDISNNQTSLLNGGSESTDTNNSAGQTQDQDNNSDSQNTEPQYFDIEFPDGMTDTEKQSLGALSKELKLDENQAKLLSNYSKNAQEAYSKKMQDTQQGWVTSLKDDPEFGGEAFDKNIAYANIALKQFDEKGELTQLLTNSGYGNNPIVVKHFAKIGKMMNDDKLILGDKGGKELSPAQILYPSN